MYSRYLPDGTGGHRRQQMPVNPPPGTPTGHNGAAHGNPNGQPTENSGAAQYGHMRPGGPGGRPPPPPFGGHGGASPTGAPFGGHGGAQPIGHPFGGHGGPPMGLPFGGLGGLLHGLDTEDMLILAVLLLAMKEDGAGKTELLIAAALYLMLGNGAEPV